MRFPALLVLFTWLLVLFPCIGAKQPYVPSKAEQAVWFSAAAYCNRSLVSQWSKDCYPCQQAGPLTNVSTYMHAKTNTFAFTGLLPNAIMVAFRGTDQDSIENWITDFNASMLQPYPGLPGVGVHSGFYTAWEYVSGSVLTDISTLSKATNLPVVITGHSLGAALATLCTFDVVHHLGLQPDVFTFGDPRVGNAAFASMYKSGVANSWRLVHWQDIVPHVPMLSMGFHHVATEVWYNSAFSDFVVCDGSGEDPLCSDSLKLTLSVQDHLHYFNVTVGDTCGLAV